MTTVNFGTLNRDDWFCWNGGAYAKKSKTKAVSIFGSETIKLLETTKVEIKLK